MSTQHSNTPIIVAIVAIIIALASFGYAFIASSGGNQSGQVSSLSSEVSSLQSNIGSLPVVNQAPTTVDVHLEWGFFISAQDRVFPQNIIVVQGDTLAITFADNDTDGGHTWTIGAPTGTNGALQVTQLNLTTQGQWMYNPPTQPNPWNGTESKGAPTGCITMGQNVPCNTTGGCSINGGAIGACTGSWMLSSSQTETASIQAHVTLGPLLKPGVYRYFCTYHQFIGMVGYLVVLPNQAFTSH